MGRRAREVNAIDIFSTDQIANKRRNGILEYHNKTIMIDTPNGPRRVNRKILTVSDEVAGKLRELVGVISRIEERLFNLSTTGKNTTDIEILIENAKTLIEDAEALAEENPDEAKELTEVVEELLDKAIDLIEGKTKTESNVSVAAFEPDDGDDDDETDKDESDNDEEDSTSSELPNDEPDDVEINE